MEKKKNKKEKGLWGARSRYQKFSRTKEETFSEGFKGISVYTGGQKTHARKHDGV